MGFPVKQISPLACCFLLFNGAVMAQSIDLKKDLNMAAANLIGLEYLMTNDAIEENTLPNLESNSVYIGQIGSGNLVNAFFESKRSEVEITQQGNGNNILLAIDTNTYDGDITQKGNNNFFSEYTSSPNYKLEHNVGQIGNNNNLVIHGSNSLSEKIDVKILGDSKTIIIRNFQ